MSGNCKRFLYVRALINLLGDLQPVFELVHGRLNVLPILVRVAFHHCQCPVTRDSFDGRQIYTGLYSGGALPQGWSALALSFTPWVPLVLLPFLAVRHVDIQGPAHWRGAAGSLVACAVAHLFLWGTDERLFRGFCGYARLWFAHSALISEIVTLPSYSATIIGLTTWAYWRFARPEVALGRRFFLLRIALATGAPFFAGSAFILLHFPDSVVKFGEDVGLRGMVVGIALDIGLALGVYFV